MATLTAASLSSFSSNVIIQPAEILVEAKKEPTPPGCFTLYDPNGKPTAYYYESDVNKKGTTTYNNITVVSGARCNC